MISLISLGTQFLRTLNNRNFNMIKIRYIYRFSLSLYFWDLDVRFDILKHFLGDFCWYFLSFCQRFCLFFSLFLQLLFTLDFVQNMAIQHKQTFFCCLYVYFSDILNVGSIFSLHLLNTDFY